MTLLPLKFAKPLMPLIISLAIHGLFLSTFIFLFSFPNESRLTSINFLGSILDRQETQGKGSQSDAQSFSPSMKGNTQIVNQLIKTTQRQNLIDKPAMSQNFKQPKINIRPTAGPIEEIKKSFGPNELPQKERGFEAPLEPYHSIRTQAK